MYFSRKKPRLVQVAEAIEPQTRPAAATPPRARARCARPTATSEGARASEAVAARQAGGLIPKRAALPSTAGNVWTRTLIVARPPSSCIPACAARRTAACFACVLVVAACRLPPPGHRGRRQPRRVPSNSIRQTRAPARRARSCVCVQWWPSPACGDGCWLSLLTAAGAVPCARLALLRARAGGRPVGGSAPPACPRQAASSTRGKPGSSKGGSKGRCRAALRCALLLHAHALLLRRRRRAPRLPSSSAAAASCRHRVSA